MADIRFRGRRENQSVVLPAAWVDDYLCEADGTAWRLLLYLLRNSDRELDLASICTRLQISPAQAEAALSLWVEKKVLTEEAGYLRLAPSVVTAPRERALPAKEQLPTGTELAARRQGNPELGRLADYAAGRLGKMLTVEETGLLFALYDELGFSPELIALLLEHCASQGKRSLRYIYKTALTWADEGVGTPELAEKYIETEAFRRSAQGRLRELMGLGGRALSPRERDFLCCWTEEWRFDFDMLGLAYEKMIDQKGTISFPYMNAILKGWHEKGYQSAAEAREEKKPEPAVSAPAEGRVPSASAAERDAYRTVSRRFEERRHADDEASRRRREAVLRKEPRMAELETESAAAAAALAKRLMKGGDARSSLDTLRRRMEELQAERAALLARLGLPADYLERAYRCEACRDTGYIGDKPCACFARELAEERAKTAPRPAVPAGV